MNAKEKLENYINTELNPKISRDSGEVKFLGYLDGKLQLQICSAEDRRLTGEMERMLTQDLMQRCLEISSISIEYRYRRGND